MRKLLVISPAWLGDIVMSQSLLKVLKQREPLCRIDVYAPAYAQRLLERMPECGGRLVNPFGHGVLALGERWREGRRLKMRGYDCAYVLPHSFKSALPPFFARIPERRGWRGEMRRGLINRMRSHEDAFPLMVERYVALAYEPDEVPDHTALPAFPYPQLRLKKPRPELLASIQLRPGAPLLALGCGANYGPSKLWPARYFALVCDWWLAAGGEVLSLGTKADRRVSAAIAAQLKTPKRTGFHDLTGATSITDALDLIGISTAAVCNDSGLMHLTAAAGIPQICLFGSSTAQYTPPLSTWAVCLESDEPCHPCFARTCKLGTYACQNGLKPAAVVRELERVLNAARPTPGGSA